MTYKPTKRENEVFAAYHALLRRETVRAAYLQAKQRRITKRIEAIAKARAA